MVPARRWVHSFLLLPLGARTSSPPGRCIDQTYGQSKGRERWRVSSGLSLDRQSGGKASHGGRAVDVSISRPLLQVNSSSTAVACRELIPVSFFVSLLYQPPVPSHTPLSHPLIVLIWPCLPVVPPSLPRGGPVSSMCASQARLQEEGLPDRAIASIHRLNFQLGFFFPPVNFVSRLVHHHHHHPIPSSS